MIKNAFGNIKFIFALVFMYACNYIELDIDNVADIAIKFKISPRTNVTDQSNIASNAIMVQMHCISMKLVTLIASNNSYATNSHFSV